MHYLTLLPPVDNLVDSSSLHRVLPGPLLGQLLVLLLVSLVQSEDEEYVM